MSFEELSYEKKYYLLGAGIVLFFFFGYRLSFKDTISVYKDIQVKKERLKWLTEKEQEIPKIREKMKHVEMVYAKQDSVAIRDRLTAFISSYAEKNRCTVVEIPANTLFENQNMNVQTNIFTLKGRFIDLLPVVYQLETEFRFISKIMSVKFYVSKDLHSKKRVLFLTIFTQAFEQKTKNQL